MKLTKYGHACVLLEKDGRSLVIDPGVFSDAPLLDEVAAVLITHGHADHLDIERLAASGPLEVWTCAAVAEALAETPASVHVVADGDRFEAAGFAVQVFGERHAQGHPDVSIASNVGFLIDEEVFYPGDALTVPEVPVPTLLLPTHAPWMRGREMIDYLRTVRPVRAYSTHDGMLNEHGLASVDAWLGLEAQRAGDGADIRRLAMGESITLG
ncbi:MBL fold metallo-hydrolase [Agromyces sp. H66]|uniref:MBL fold metallo-hydrolase n=1 Tax=Agromyces sp. H66 TaxID=2529859 RepID=UPI0010A9CAA9|nr:MBL fold metallo-hydrolase [Agromyces sp. H66]